MAVLATLALIAAVAGGDAEAPVRQADRMVENPPAASTGRLICEERPTAGAARARRRCLTRTGWRKTAERNQVERDRVFRYLAVTSY